MYVKKAVYHSNNKGPSGPATNLAIGWSEAQHEKGVTGGNHASWYVIG